MSGSPERPAQAAPQPSVYERIGGADGVRALVARFYELMDELPEAYRVRRLHPESLAGSADSLFKFLSGWFGGPPLYVAERGHPRLRMRHLPYAIGPAERDEWLLCMRQALAEQVKDDALRALVDRAFTEMADHMVNTAPGLAPRGAR
ncbi:MAG: group II truncated hemoglobin [Burkholderiaceae bacterium]|nr:group II truncated hemoglobin [Burkholderiaceae bacterium]